MGQLANLEGLALAYFDAASNLASRPVRSETDKRLSVGASHLTFGGKGFNCRPVAFLSRCQSRQPADRATNNCSCLRGETSVRIIPRRCAIEIEAHALVKGCHRVLLAQESCGGRSQDQRLRIAEESTTGLSFSWAKSDSEFRLTPISHPIGQCGTQ